MDIFENIVVSGIFSIISEQNEPVGTRTKTHVNYAEGMTELKHYELWYSNREVVVIFNGKKLHVKPGCVTFLPKGAITEYCVDRISQKGYINIYFDTCSPMPSEAFTFNMSGNISIETLFRKIHSTWIMRRKIDRLLCYSLLYQILHIISAATSAGSYAGTSQREKIQPAVEYISRHCFDFDFDCGGLAELCGISYSYLKRLFISVYKMPPSQYVTHVRMEQAKDIFQTKSHTIQTVAQMLGYTDAAYFSKAFKKYAGVSPREFIKQLDLFVPKNGGGILN